jgi:hypothetical protein
MPSPTPETAPGMARRRASRHTARCRRVGAMTVIATVLVLSGCGSNGAAGQGAGSQAANAAVAQTCLEVTAVLSDGPDPTADPVGYAEAQVLPLRSIKTSVAALGRAIDDLAAAYETQFRDNAAAAASSAVASEEANMNKLCPGAAP